MSDVELRAPTCKCDACHEQVATLYGDFHGCMTTVWCSGCFALWLAENLRSLKARPAVCSRCLKKVIREPSDWGTFRELPQ